MTLLATIRLKSVTLEMKAFIETEAQHLQISK